MMYMKIYQTSKFDTISEKWYRDHFNTNIKKRRKKIMKTELSSPFGPKESNLSQHFFKSVKFLINISQSSVVLNEERERSFVMNLETTEF